MAKAPKTLPVELVLRRLVDPVTGEQVAAFVAASDADRSMLRERGFRLNTAVRAVLTMPRNPRFNRLVHGLGKAIARNLERFAGLQSHAAIKELQTESGAACDETRTPIPGVGELVSRRPRSLAFDEMGEDEFQDFWRQVCAYLIAHDWPSLTPEQVTEMAEVEQFTGGV
jgi:hypothetical protein